MLAISDKIVSDHTSGRSGGRLFLIGAFYKKVQDLQWQVFLQSP